MLGEKMDSGKKCDVRKKMDIFLSIQDTHKTNTMRIIFRRGFESQRVGVLRLKILIFY